jgi:hypothetical protein
MCSLTGISLSYMSCVGREIMANSGILAKIHNPNASSSSNVEDASRPVDWGTIELILLD